MLKKVTGLMLALIMLLSPYAALAAAPAAAPAATPGVVSVPAAAPLITYKTILKNGDYYVAVRTDNMEFTALPDGGTTVAFTLRWSYLKPEKFADNFPTVKQFTWQYSRYALQYDTVTGLAKFMELETLLFDRLGQPAAQLKTDRSWRILLPTDPNYEVFEQFFRYLTDLAK
ncbi:MAG TPA: hypothetical protein VN521_02755 [Negativicutes bacterium]|nr:hypothetical protein [Negativicutes bacterium]